MKVRPLLILLLFVVSTGILVWIYFAALRGQRAPHRRQWTETLADLDAHALLGRMETAEKSGASFKDIHVSDIKPVKYAGSVAAAIVITTFMAAVFFLILWAMITEPEGRPPIALMIIILAIPIIIILGLFLSLAQRIKEINKGEIKDAKKF